MVGRLHIMKLNMVSTQTLNFFSEMYMNLDYCEDSFIYLGQKIFLFFRSPF